MRSITATQASRNFAALLDVVEQGESVLVTRDGTPIGRFVPENTPIAVRIEDVMRRHPVDPSFADDLEAVVHELRSQCDEVRKWPTD